MPSSISSSKHPALFYAKLLVGLCAFLILVFELLSDFLLKHHSETYARVSQQYEEAVKMRPAKPGDPTSVLMIGNSLLLYGVDVGPLKELDRRPSPRLSRLPRSHCLLRLALRLAAAVSRWIKTSVRRSRCRGEWFRRKHRPPGVCALNAL